MKALSLQRNFVWTSVGTLAKSTALWLQIVLIGKMLGPEVLGRFSLAISVSMPVFTIFGLSMGRVMVVDTEDRHTFAEYFGARIFFNFLSLIVVLGIGWTQFDDPAALGILVGVVLWHCLELSFILTSAYFQKIESMNYLGRSRITYAIILLGGMALGVVHTRGVVAGLIAIVICSSLLFHLYDLRKVRQTSPVSPVIQPRILGELVAKCWLISLASGTTILAGHLPRFLIESSLGTRDVGFFVAANLASVGVVLVVVSLAQSALRRLAVRFQGDLTGFVRLLLKLKLIAFGFAALNLLFSLIAGEWALSLLFGAEYAVFAPVMVTLAFASVFTTQVAIIGDTIIATRRYGWRLVAAVCSIIAIAVAARSLVPHLGLEGIAYACLIGSAVDYLFCATALSVLILRKRKQGFAEESGSKDSL